MYSPSESMAVTADKSITRWALSPLSALARALLRCGTVSAFIMPVTVHTVVLGWGCVSAVVMGGFPAADNGGSLGYHGLSLIIGSPPRSNGDDTLHVAISGCEPPSLQVHMYVRVHVHMLLYSAFALSGDRDDHCFSVG